MLSEKVFSDNENNGRLSNSSKSHSYEYDDKNNLISEEEITKSNTDIVRVTASYEYRYDENGRKVRQDHTYVDIDTDLNISEYTTSGYRISDLLVGKYMRGRFETVYASKEGNII